MPVVAVSTPSSNANSDEITDDEFEVLLDQLHGKARAQLLMHLKLQRQRLVRLWPRLPQAVILI